MIEKSVLLACDITRAFALFTQRMTDWWPPERRHTGDAASAMLLEPTGRFCERASDGREIELGRVKVWEEPRRLVLDWYPGTDAEHPTEVEVQFEPEGNGTRVLVHHRAKPISAALFPLRAPRYEASWDRVLAALTRAV